MADLNNASEPSQTAEKVAKSAGATGHKLKKAWEWGEHIHFAHFLWTTVLAPAPAAILFIWHAIAHTTHSFWSLLVLTAPMTIAVALIIHAIRQKKQNDSGLWTYVGLPAIVLLGSAYISSRSEIGKAFDWHKALPQGHAQAQMTSWMTVPLAALGAYYEVYGAAAFFLSLIVGIILGVATSTKSPY